METFQQKLIFSKVIGLDTSVFIYHLESYEKYRSVTRQIFTSIEHGDCSAITSVLTLLELNVRPFQLKKPEVAHHYEILLVNFPNLKIVDVDREISRKAAQLRAKYNIRTPDAIQMATCILKGSKFYLTNDKDLAKLNKEIEIGFLDDLA